MTVRLQSSSLERVSAKVFPLGGHQRSVLLRSLILFSSFYFNLLDTKGRGLLFKEGMHHVPHCFEEVLKALHIK